MSGVAKYAFQISEDGSSWTTASTISSTETTYEYTYSSLDSSTTYYMRVIVYDAAGNSTTSSSVNQTTETGVLYLYYYGDECEDVTGGWTFGYEYTKSGCKGSLESNYIYLYASLTNASSDSYPTYFVQTKNSIDFSDYTTMYVYTYYAGWNYYDSYDHQSHYALAWAGARGCLHLHF